MTAGVGMTVATTVAVSHHLPSPLLMFRAVVPRVLDLNLLGAFPDHGHWCTTDGGGGGGGGGYDDRRSCKLTVDCAEMLSVILFLSSTAAHGQLGLSLLSQVILYNCLRSLV